MSFQNKFADAINKNDSLLCIGLDPQAEKMPQGLSALYFNKAIIEATHDLVCAYKPNLAFYEALGEEGYHALKETIKAIPQDIPVIADAKRGDIGNTSKAYAKAVFEELGADAVTVSPYLGYDSLKPFIDYRDKGVFILCRTSNPGSEDFQSLKLGDRHLYELVAEKAAQWNRYKNIGLVVGATYPQEIKLIRQLNPKMPLLIPGAGAQGGDIKEVVASGIDESGGGIIINSSRQILYASKGGDFAKAARKAAQSLREQINNSKS